MKSVPIQDASIMAGGTRIVREMRGSQFQRFWPTRSVAVPASRAGASTTTSASSSPRVHARRRMVRVERGFTTAISIRAMLELER